MFLRFSQRTTTHCMDTLTAPHKPPTSKVLVPRVLGVNRVKPQIQVSTNSWMSLFTMKENVVQQASKISFGKYVYIYIYIVYVGK